MLVGIDREKWLEGLEKAVERGPWCVGKDTGNASVTSTALILHWTPKNSVPYGASEYQVKLASPNLSL